MPSPRVLSLTALVAAAALGQGFELDLSEEKAPAAPTEFRPTIALLSVRAPEGDEVSVARAKLLEAELLKQLGQGEDFQTVIAPEAARQGLAELAPATDDCRAAECFAAAQRRLRVHRVVRFTVQKQGAGSLVTMLGFDPALAELVTQSQDSGEKAEKAFLGVAGKTQVQKDREFLRRTSGFLGTALRALATPNGRIAVDNADPSALVTIDDVEVGTGSLGPIAQRGARTVRVTAAGYKPFEQTVTVEPLKTAEVKVTLVALPLDAAALQLKQPAGPSGPSLFERPGFYLALGGAAAVVAGVALGQVAQGVKDRIAQGGDPVQVTRVEAQAATAYAAAANVLVGLGVAAVAGGVTWVVLTPTATRLEAGEPTDSTPISTGWMLGVGGTF